MKKAEAYLGTILKIIHSPRGIVLEKELMKYLNKPYSTFRRYIGELKNDFLIDGHPAIIEISQGTDKAYTLNASMFKYFYPNHLETAFYLEAYQKIGSLLDHKNLTQDIKELKDEVFNLNGRGEELKRKFYYLSHVNSINESKDLNHQAIIVQALIENKTLNIHYNKKDYFLYPLSICQYRDALYLVAYKDQPTKPNIRKFKITRIQSIDINKQGFSYPDAKTWNPSSFFQETSGIITGEVREVTIRVYSLSRQHIKEKTFFNSKHIKTSHDYDEYILKYTNLDEFLGQIFVYAQDIEIIDDEKLRLALIDKAEKAIHLNQKKKAA